ncbi:MAG TPA: glycosyltransferase [Rubrivivax sp.]|nr:glycosyltransferase [Rubrivivax sp.]
MKPNVDLVYFDAGGGHRAAAEALRDVLHRQGRPWSVRLVNLTQVLDPTAGFQRWTGLKPEDLYNCRLRRGWTLGMTQELRLLQAAIAVAHRPLVKRLRQHWTATAPDLVVSLIPNFNLALGRSLSQARPGVPFATVMTDLADLPPRFWIEPRVQQHLICGTPQAREQALSAGLAPERVSLVSGMLLRPSFYDSVEGSVASSRRALGLDPGRPVVAVLYGGHGSRDMLRIAQLLQQHQLLLFTGHNTALAQRLRQLPAKAPRAVLGFTREMACRLQLADMFIGKPGPGALSEALHVGLPVVTFENAWTMPQERCNAHWVRESGFGLVLPSLASLPEGVARMCSRLDEFRARVGRLQNRALFEVPLLLEALLQASPCALPSLVSDRSVLPPSDLLLQQA